VPADAEVEQGETEKQREHGVLGEVIAVGIDLGQKPNP
jgi:hypothetical protein